MSIHKQSQFELFSLSGSVRPQEPPKPRYFLKSLTLSLETLVVFGIMVIMGMVVSYSLGIEQGKKRRLATHRPRSTNVAPQPKPTTAVPATVKPAVAAVKNPKTMQSPAPAPVRAPVATPTIAAAKSDTTLILSKPPVAPEVVAADIEKFYTIQVASYKGEKYAQKEASLLKQKGYDILVVPKGAFSIVCVGKFKEKEEAKNFSKKLKKQYKDCLVRSL